MRRKRRAFAVIWEKRIAREENRQYTEENHHNKTLAGKAEGHRRQRKEDEAYEQKKIYFCVLCF